MEIYMNDGLKKINNSIKNGATHTLNLFDFIFSI